MDKLKDYFRHSDFEEYFRHPNRTGESEYIREKLIESDFMVSWFHGYYLVEILAVIVLIKWGLFIVGE